MQQNVTAVYERGVLILSEPLKLCEGAKVSVIENSPDDQDLDESPYCELIDHEYERHASLEADDSVSIEAVRNALAKIPGSMSEVVIRERGEY